MGEYLCLSCSQSLVQVELVCPICERAAIGGATHPLCQRGYGLDGLWSLGAYQGALKAAIAKLKYRFVSSLAVELVNLLTQYWAFYNPQFLDDIKKNQGSHWLIVPVPLHWRRQNYRGFNQAALLGKILSNRVGLDYCEVLERVRNTQTQVGKTAKNRRKNIFNAFALNTKYRIRDTKILLIDDVWTTGSTLKECCYVLKRSGAKKVWAITLAR